MASLGNQHCASCIGTLSFHINDSEALSGACMTTARQIAFHKRIHGTSLT